MDGYLTIEWEHYDNPIDYEELRAREEYYWDTHEYENIYQH